MRLARKWVREWKRERGAKLRETLNLSCMRACLSKKIYLAHYYYEASLRSICSNALTRYVLESLSLLLLLLPLPQPPCTATVFTTVVAHVQLNKHKSMNDTVQWLNMHSGISKRCMLQYIGLDVLLRAVCIECVCVFKCKCVLFVISQRWLCAYFGKLVCTLRSLFPHKAFHPSNFVFLWLVVFFSLYSCCSLYSHHCVVGVA